MTSDHADPQPDTTTRRGAVHEIEHAVVLPAQPRDRVRVLRGIVRRVARRVEVRPDDQ